MAEQTLEIQSDDKLVASTKAAVDAVKVQEAVEADREKKILQQSFVGLLLKGNDRIPENDRQLGELADELGLTPEAVANQQRIVLQVPALTARHEDHGAAGKAVVVAGSALRDTIKRHKEELSAARRVRFAADHRLQLASNARDDLIGLEKRCPLLFAESEPGELPRLRKALVKPAATLVKPKTKTPARSQA